MPDTPISEQEKVIRELVYAVTGVGLPVWVWNNDRDTKRKDSDGISILLGCAEMCNYGEWTPEVAAAFKVVTEYMMTAQRKQVPWRFERSEGDA